MAIELSNPTPSRKTDVKPKQGLSWNMQIGKASTKVTVAERMQFTERLALMLETGMSLHPALTILGEQTKSPAFKNVIEKMIAVVTEGKPFSEALAKHPQVFDNTYVNLVKASEQGGFMHQVLEQLVAMDEKQQELNSTISSALSYPAFLILFSIGVVVFVLVAVFPKFTEMFKQIHDQLPISTIILMWMSDMIRSYWYLILPAIAGAVGGLVYWLKQPQGTLMLDNAKLTMPGVSNIFIQIYMTRLLRVMSISLGNGVSILDTLVACREVIRNSKFREYMLQIEIKVTEGKGIAAGFADAPFIPALVKQMISTGEETGNLAKVMGRVADFYDRELSKRVTTLAKLAEPVMLLVMGAVVGIIVSSLILPIFKLSKAVH
jgi:type II secretory pathway component PulF